jgi:hypothetical protein
MKSGGSVQSGSLRSLPAIEYAANDFRMLEVQTLVATTLTWRVVKNGSASGFSSLQS